MTFHDLAFLANPRWFPLARRIYYRFRYARLARSATHLIADTHFVAGEITGRLGIDRDRISVVYLSAEHTPATPLPFRERTGVAGDYVLFVGTIEPRKNLGALLDAWEILKREGLHGKLVIVGRFGWEAKGMRNRLRSSRDVVWTGHLQPELLASAYSGARLLVYPSLYEGFGLPPLEAACYGVPSVVGPAGALVEVYGEISAGVIPSSDPSSIAYALATALESHHDRRAIREFSLGFGHEDMARSVTGVYRRVLER